MLYIKQGLQRMFRFHKSRFPGTSLIRFSAFYTSLPDIYGRVNKDVSQNRQRATDIHRDKQRHS
jgi:hypothetical protein